MNSSEYRKYHETFMQNNYGSNAFHTFCCIFFTIQSSIIILLHPKLSVSRQYIYEYLVIVLPMILAHTVLAEYIYILNCLQLGILAYNLLRFRNALKKFNAKNIFHNDRIPIISSLRGLTYLITVLCILAVDFRDFPRSLAKTEKFGYSLMDTGVGLFVTMSGIVHKDLHNDSFKTIVKSNSKIVLILTFLGIARFVAIKQLDYQEHVTEYGVHWNFFFTIAVCKTISTVLLYLFNDALLLSIVTLVLHEMLLCIGVQSWVFSDAPRDSLLSANREGISSCLGFVSIYLFSAYIRRLLLTNNVIKYDVLKKLLYGSVISWLLMYCWDFIQPTSRTLANAGYCLFMDTILITITSVMYFTMVLCEEKDNNAIPLILSTVNSNGLSYFLIANLMTGAVNLSMRTLLVSSTVTFMVLNGYMIVTLAIIVYLKSKGFRI